MKKSTLLFILTALAGLFLASCEMLYSMTGAYPDNQIVDSNTPAIPLPSSATDEPPQKSSERITDSRDIENFSVYLSSGEGDEPVYVNGMESAGITVNGSYADYINGPTGWLSYLVNGYRVKTSAYYPLVKNGALIGSSAVGINSYTSGTSEVPIQIFVMVSDYYDRFNFNPLLQEHPLI